MTLAEEGPSEIGSASARTERKKIAKQRGGGGAQEAFRRAAVSVAPSLLVDAASDKQRGGQQRWVVGPPLIALENRMALQRSIEGRPK